MLFRGATFSLVSYISCEKRDPPTGWKASNLGSKHIPQAGTQQFRFPHNGFLPPGRLHELYKGTRKESFPLNTNCWHKKSAHALLSGTRNDVVQIIIQEKEAVCLDLFFEELSTWISGHG